jgi:hypothetical protein
VSTCSSAAAAAAAAVHRATAEAESSQWHGLLQEQQQQQQECHTGREGSKAAGGNSSKGSARCSCNMLAWTVALRVVSCHSVASSAMGWPPSVGSIKLLSRRVLHGSSCCRLLKSFDDAACTVLHGMVCYWACSRLHMGHAVICSALVSGYDADAICVVSRCQTIYVGRMGFNPSQWDYHM